MTRVVADEEEAQIENDERETEGKFADAHRRLEALGEQLDARTDRRLRVRLCTRA